MAITINGNGTISGITAGGLPTGSVTTDTLATSAKALFSSYALLTDRKDGATDGGTNTANTWQKRTLNYIAVDPDNIVTLNDSEFTLGAGNYFIKFIVPNYKSTSTNAQLYDVTAGAPIQTNAVNMTSYGHSTYAGYSFAHSWGRITISSGTNTYYIRNYSDAANTSGGWGLNIPDDNADYSFYTTVEIYKEV